MPSLISKLSFWGELEDACYGHGVLSKTNRTALKDSAKKCLDPLQWFDFASNVFPAHQLRPEIMGMLALAAKRQPRVVMEIGTAQAGTQFLLGQVLNSVELILAVDLRVKNKMLLNEFSRDGLKRVCLEGSSYDQTTIRRVESVLAGQKIDVLFIDGDHTYEGVKADYCSYQHLVKQGGLIVFHDIVEDHQTRFGQSSGGWAGDVPIYWRELKAAAPYGTTWEFIADPEQDGMGIGILENVSKVEISKP